jgi:hypothetical protein
LAYLFLNYLFLKIKLIIFDIIYMDTKFKIDFPKLDFADTLSTSNDCFKFSYKIPSVRNFEDKLPVVDHELENDEDSSLNTEQV